MCWRYGGTPIAQVLIDAEGSWPESKQLAMSAAHAEEQTRRCSHSAWQSREQMLPAGRVRKR